MRDIWRHPQLLTESGTQRPVWPLTLQTSCFNDVPAMQHAPEGTGRLALAPFWRSMRMASRGRAATPSTSAMEALARAVMAKMMVEMESFMVTVVLTEWSSQGNDRKVRPKEKKGLRLKWQSWEINVY